MNIDTILNILNNDLVQRIVIFLITLIGGLKFLKNKAIAKWTMVAFQSVEEFARIDEEKGNKMKTDDKINLFCQTLKSLMQKAGWLLVSDKDLEQAKIIAKSINLIYTKGQEAIEAGKELVKPEPVDPNASNPTPN